MLPNITSWFAARKDKPAGKGQHQVSRREISAALRDNKERMIVEAHANLERKRKEERRNTRRRTGAVSLSNTDSIQRAMQVRSRLLSKLSEAAGSDMDPRTRDALLADIQLQLDRVDQMIAAIRRRLRAIEAEKQVRRKDDTPEKRRRRWQYMQERRIYIRRDYLYHADKGGFDPNGMSEIGESVNAAL